MKRYNVAILGATGAVGEQMIRVLWERRFPIGGLRLLSSERSAGGRMDTPFGNAELGLACETAFEGADIVLGAAENDIARRFAPAIRAAGAVFVDNSSAFRMDPDVPLVVPEINPDDALKHNGIISNPNCSAIIALTAVNAINKLSPIEYMVVSTYQAVSGAGAGGPMELEAQVAALQRGEAAEKRVFRHQIAYNLIPEIGGADGQGYTSEEMKMQNEGRKIMHLPELRVTCTCVRVPVMRSHSISASIVTERELTVDEVREAIAGAPGCVLEDDMERHIYPMPLFTGGLDTVAVGRIRRDIALKNGIALWCCGDQLRKGAATNAVQIAELLISK